MSEEKAKPTLAPNVVTTLVTALAECITNARGSGAALIPFCNAAAKAKLPANPSEPDIAVIVDNVASKLGWNDAKYKRGRQSKSEARAIVRNHAIIPELRTALQASPHGAAGYHDMVKLARSMKDHKTVRAAVLAFNTRAAAKKADTLASLERAVKAHYKTVSNMRSDKKNKLLVVLAEFADVMGIEAVKS